MMMAAWRRLLAILLLAVGPMSLAFGDGPVPVRSKDVYVVDGDTIRVRGSSYRLVGFDAPEIGQTAECEAEVARGFDAKARVVDLVWSGKPLTLERTACSCAPGTSGTMLCNYARRCGTLRVAGEDVGAILIRAGLAKPYPYRWPNPPPKPRWCGPLQTPLDVRVPPRIRGETRQEQAASNKGSNKP